MMLVQSKPEWRLLAELDVRSQLRDWFGMDQEPKELRSGRE